MASESGTYGPEVIARRLKMAEALLGDAPPVQHWAQGLNELLKGYTGGQMFRRAEDAERSGSERQYETIARFLSGAGGGIEPGPAGPSAPPATDSGITTGPRPTGASPLVGTDTPIEPRRVAAVPIQPSPTQGIIPTGGGDVPYEAGGMPTRPPQEQISAAIRAAVPAGAPVPQAGAMPPAPAPQPTTAAPTGSPTTELPPTAATNPIASRVAAALRSKDPYERRAAGTLAPQMIAAMIKPSEYKKLNDEQIFDTHSGRTYAAGAGYRPLVSTEERAAHGIPTDDKRPYQLGPGNKLVNPPPETKVSMSTVVDPVMTGIAERFNDQFKGAQAAAANIIPSIHEARKALDQGAITGAVADPQLMLSKVGAIFGVGGDKIANTEVLRSAVGSQVLAQAKTLGANPSNTDREYIENVVGGKISLDEKTIRRLLDMQEKWARQSIGRANDAGKKLLAADKDGKLTQLAPLMSIDEPQSYDDFVRSNAGPAVGGGGGRPTKTIGGKAYYQENGQWFQQ